MIFLKFQKYLFLNICALNFCVNIVFPNQLCRSEYDVGGVWRRWEECGGGGEVGYERGEGVEGGGGGWSVEEVGGV